MTAGKAVLKFLKCVLCVTLQDSKEIITRWIFVRGNSTFPHRDYFWLLDGSSWLLSLFKQPLWLQKEIKLMLEIRAQQQGVGGRGKVPHTVLACVAMTTGSADKPPARWPWIRRLLFSPCFGRWSQIDSGRWKQANQRCGNRLVCMCVCLCVKLRLQILKGSDLFQRELSMLCCVTEGLDEARSY